MRRIFLPLPLVLLLASCAQQIQTGLSEHEAQEILVTLRENGIDAYAQPESIGKKDNVQWKVMVKGGNEKAVTAWKVLGTHHLPHEKVPDLIEVLAKSGSIIPTLGEEKARMMVGLAGQLTRTLRSVPGVVDAFVQVVLPDNTSLIDKKDQNPTTASVVVLYSGVKSPLTNDEIQGLVAKGVEGLTTNNVKVVQLRPTEKPLPPHPVGPPLGAREWTTIGALALSGLTSAGALSMLVLSKRRSFRIKMLERQLLQLTEGSARV